MIPNPLEASPATDAGWDEKRRFGALRRLHGDDGYARLRALRVAVVGLGGVGSWAAEALARSGVAQLVLIDLDHVAESNINRQVQALQSTLGQAKVQALSQRIAQIHPGCRVHGVEDFVEPANWPQLLPVSVDAVIDACDQTRAKLALAQWALATRTCFVSCGAAGGKQQPQGVQVADLADVTHDPLLASVRQQLRKSGAAPSATTGVHRKRSKAPRIGVQCIYVREPVVRGSDCAVDGSLNCHGYGSSVMVTATMGLTAAAAAVSQCLSVVSTRNAPEASANMPGSAGQGC